MFSDGGLFLTFDISANSPDQDVKVFCDGETCIQCNAMFMVKGQGSQTPSVEFVSCCVPGEGIAACVFGEVVECLTTHPAELSAGCLNMVTL